MEPSKKTTGTRSPPDKIVSDPLAPVMSGAGFIRTKTMIPGIVPVSRATLWRMVKAGTFPAPVKLSAGVTAWRCVDVRQWLNAQGKGA